MRTRLTPLAMGSPSFCPSPGRAPQHPSLSTGEETEAQSGSLCCPQDSEPTQADSDTTCFRFAELKCTHRAPHIKFTIWWLLL